MQICLTIVKHIVVQSYDFKELPETYYGLTIPSTARANCIQQLEFTLLQMIQQVSDLLGAIQSALQGKLPMNLNKPKNFKKYTEKCVLTPA